MNKPTREELLDIDPASEFDSTVYTAREIALRHAWNWAVEAETATQRASERTRALAAVSQAWSAIAEALK